MCSGYTSKSRKGKKKKKKKGWLRVRILAVPEVEIMHSSTCSRMQKGSRKLGRGAR